MNRLYAKHRALLIILAVVILPAVIQAGVATSFELPDTGYISNVVIDIIEHNGGVWLATGDGLNFSFDDGETWLSYDNTNGLVSSSITGLYSINAGGSDNRIWVATTHEEEFDGELFTLSDGVSYSDDNGNQWNQINFGPDGLDIPFVWGGDRIIFDITGHYDEGDPIDDWMFFTAFAGGFLASRDGGMSWRRIYPSPGDSIQFNTPNVAPSLRNRYFSCVADTSHGDSLFVWAGTAAGFFQYVYAPPWEKPLSEYISRIVYCDTCPGEDSNFVYFAGDDGFTRSTKTGGPFISRFEADGLPGQSLISMIDFGNKLFAGTINPSDSSSTGLAESDSFGESFTLNSSLPATGLNQRILDFAVIGSRLYAAAEQAGLFVSGDTGQTWSHILIDSADEVSLWNDVNAVHAWGDTLLVGTDTGLAQLLLDASGNFLAAQTRFTSLVDDDSSSTRVVRIKTHEFESNEVIWTINRPLAGSGTPVVARSVDHGQTFATRQWGIITHDINFFGDTTFVVGEEGIRFTPNATNPGSDPYWILYIREVDDGEVIDSLIADTITAMEVLGDTVFLGTGRGYAVSFDRGEHFDIRRPNRDSLGADVVLHYSSSIAGLLGDFIPAMEVQYLPDTSARVWISNRPATAGRFGISVGRIDMAWRYFQDTTGAVVDSEFIQIYNWDSVYHDFAWNFAFNGDTVFAATDGGLIYAEGDSLLAGILGWDTLQLVDSLGVPLVLDGTPIFAVQVVDGFLWVGTGDRTVRIRLDDFDDQSAFFVVDPVDEVYAFPVPFSHTLDQAVEFHFVVEQETNVTLEIYDFAMNLVRRVIDNQPYPAGVYPTALAGRRTWDGLNGKGDRVAIGVYYFKVEYSSGEVRWGKLAVIP